MPSLQVKHVPDDVHATLRERAARRGQSLQEYTLHLLSEHTARPTLDEVFDRIEACPPDNDVTADEIVALVRADRDSR